MTHTVFDHILILVIVVLSTALDLWLYPRLVRATQAGVAGARIRFYNYGLVTQWTITGGVIGLWIWQGRAWGALLLGFDSPLRLAIGLALAAGYVWLMLAQRRALLAKPERLAALAKSMSSADALLPHTPTERQAFKVVALTAGICEEVLFRGFVLWYFSVWTGWISAVVISSIFFGCAHLYLGVKHIQRTAMVGLIFALIAVAANSLWPVMIIHAAMDLVAGDLLGRREASAEVNA